ncbi:hypothetical protein Tco_0901217 [Tanacetum coccineum]
MTNVNTEVVQPSLIHRTAYHSPIATQLASPSWSIQRGNVEGGESSRRGPLYVPDWSIHQRCRLDTPMWCRELMVHLAPPTTQEESNALNNATTLKRAWFSLARGALAQTDILERFEHLQADFDRLVETHAECGETVGKFVQARLDLAYSSHLYTTLSERYKAVNRLGEERSEEDLLALMSRMEEFDVYADKKMRVEYNKLFEKRYPYVEKISRSYRHSVSDLLKVYPDSPPFRQAPPSKPSSGRAASTSTPRES